MSTVEAPSLDAAIQYASAQQAAVAEHVAQSETMRATAESKATQHAEAATALDATITSLQRQQVTGAPIAALQQARDALQAAAQAWQAAAGSISMTQGAEEQAVSAWGTAHDALDGNRIVQHAYQANRDAGDEQHLTGGGSTP